MNGENEKQRRKKPVVLILVIIVLVIAAGVYVWYEWFRVVPEPPVKVERISAENLMLMPLMQQGDYRESVAVFSGKHKSVATSGCGAVCVAMSASYLTGEEVSPETLFQWAYDNKFYFGDGLGHDALTAMAEQYGLTGEWIDNGDTEKVKEALLSGYPVVAHMGPGVFTRAGHYILLRGMADEENVWVNDPQSIELSQEPHSLEGIRKELRRENSFMIIKPCEDEADEGTDL